MGRGLPTGVKPADNLGVYWDKPVSELATLPASAISPPDAERHSIYSLLTMALVFGYWNGNKNGAEGTYPWRPKQIVSPGRYRGDRFGDRYLGHNIACIAVDETGEIIDFDFNHNEIYNSSAEHAEARLIRRIFSLNQVYDHWQTHAAGETRFVPYGNVFNGVTVYTSLESCAQCSGVMTLASCLRVVFLQSDPGQSVIGNMLYNLTRRMRQPKFAAAGYSRPSPANKYGAPEPLDATRFGFKYKKALDDAYLSFSDRVATDEQMYFFKREGAKPEDPPNRSTSITSFLCTDLALEIFQAAFADLGAFTLEHPDYRPVRSDGKTDGVLKNSDVVQHAKAFFGHAITEARRGTPHR